MAFHNVDHGNFKNSERQRYHIFTHNTELDNSRNKFEQKCNKQHMVLPYSNLFIYEVEQARNLTQKKIVKVQ